MTILSDDQIITCPSCEGTGWIGRPGWIGSTACPVCDKRGSLVVDHDKTMALPEKPPYLESDQKCMELADRFYKWWHGEPMPREPHEVDKNEVQGHDRARADGPGVFQMKTVAFLFVLAAALWLVSLSMDPTPGPDAAAPHPPRYEPPMPRGSRQLGGTATNMTFGATTTICSAITTGSFCATTPGGGVTFATSPTMTAPGEYR